MLSEFFHAEADGWHNKRADAVIAEFKEAEPDREAKRENGKERVRRHRARRKEMFDSLREHGIVPDWDASTADLERMMKRVTDKPVTRYDTAIQTPDTRHQSPNTSNPSDSSSQTGSFEASDTHRAGARASAPAMTAAGQACRAMREAGLTSTNPAHPELLALIEAGATAAQFAQAAAVAVSKGKGFPYALGTLKGQLADAAAAPKPGKGDPEAIHNRNRAAAAEWLAEHSAGETP